MGPSIAESLRRIGERTAGGVRKALVTQVFANAAVVQEGGAASIAGSTTDEPIRAGYQVWTQPTKKTGGLVIHGRG